VLLLLAACAGETVASPEEPASMASLGAEALEVTGGWVRATTGTEDPSMSAAFMEIEDTSDIEVTLESARTEVAGKVELHEMVVEDGDLVMQAIEGGFTISAGETAVLEPGFDHVMLMDLQHVLRPGDEVALTLEFTDDVGIDLVLPVKKFTEEEGHYHRQGTEDHGHGDPNAPPSPHEE
jgi:copper(I)-binding protein